jgi:cell wall-associated NlpC family hydrolase
MQKASGIPWGIVGCEGLTVSYPIWLPRQPKQKYLNRRFIWFIDDCYSLVQDYYLFELNIELPNHKATEDFEQLRNFNNLFDEHILEYGFCQLPIDTKLEKGDLLLLDNAGGKRNHLGIYTGTGILHQSLISKEESLEHFINKFHRVLRHESKII